MSNFLETVPAEQATLIRNLAQQAKAAGGRLLLVGGAVRDLLSGKVPVEFDLEVFGLSLDAIERELGREIPLIQVGRSFPVVKVRDQPIDIAIPRTEWKTGNRHTDFGFEANPDLDFATAARRRDFTINAIGWDPLTQELMDPYGGEKDLRAGILRHVSDQFGEDALRVLRAMQFIARFDLTPAPETIAVCRTLEQTHLAAERIFEEWKKLILKGKIPSKGMFFLEEVGWLRFYPELEVLVDCPQDPRWHPEGTVWRHTCFCLDAFARERIGEEKEDLIVGLAVLCHDLGKATTTTTDEEGGIHSYGHEKAGIHPTRALLSRMTREKSLIEEIEPLVVTHMRPRQLFEHKSGPAAVRRLADKVGRLDRLLRVCRADTAGRPPLPPGDFPEGQWLLNRAEELNVSNNRPYPILQGRDLLKLGVDPGPRMGKLLKRLFEDQLDGKFETKDEGLERAKELADLD
ncbi:CCA tRNA nucleotidyltransferase [Puniceicoccus vermicola]|uniref:HD domain-containing protein n=1 Tax=Puniceicoccus vermicola TaxID=388746 RepID=A0A7X1E850_9BACT|nr:HD domain-containing protein [Puniceicoccus vermicola]MBC2604402.1 HD domain-containing protein [Puniceicoccus vermicola]